MNRQQQVKMYDNIRLLMPYPFKTEAEKTKFCTRFGLAVRDESKGIYNNKGHYTLKQNRGVYIRLDMPTKNKRGSITIKFSLQKFYNLHLSNEAINYNSFTRQQANEAYKLFREFIKIDLSRAVVKKYEAGFNVTTIHDPESYLRELLTINVNGREMRIIEDSHFKEYKQYSTNKDKDKRIVYIFYHKTFEAQSKANTNEQKKAVPNNLLRIEMDYKRPDKKILFDELFTPHFQLTIKTEMRKRFIDGLRCKEPPPHLSTSKQVSIYRMFEAYGIEATKQKYKDLQRSGELTKRQYTYFLTEAKQVLFAMQTGLKNDTFTQELKTLITNKIREL